jgi:hypothetical protein
MPTTHTPSQLFVRVLGDSWQQLPEELQRFHLYEGSLSARGKFYVRHGRWPAKLLAWIMGMPAAGEQVELLLKVTESAGVERWERSFAGKPMVTFQSRRADGLLIERVGLNEVYFRLDVRDGGLHFQTVGAAICIGPWRLPLPSLLRPKITASESFVADRGGITVRVEIYLPILGKLIEYGGTIEPTKVTLKCAAAELQHCERAP